MSGKTLEDYLRENINNNIIDFSIRASINGFNQITFYIHPDSKSGQTIDFDVFKNNLITKSIC